jgi:hypothetical protein
MAIFRKYVNNFTEESQVTLPLLTVTTNFSNLLDVILIYFSDPTAVANLSALHFKLSWRKKVSGFGEGNLARLYSSAFSLLISFSALRPTCGLEFLVYLDPCQIYF